MTDRSLTHYNKRKVDCADFTHIDEIANALLAKDCIVEQLRLDPNAPSVRLANATTTTPIAIAMAKNTTLKHFEGIRGSGQALADVLTENNSVSLESLRIVSSPASANADADCLAKAMLLNTTLKSLCLWCMPESPRDSFQYDLSSDWATVLGVNTTLEELELCDCSIPQDVMPKFAESLKRNTSLMSLTFCSSTLHQGVHIAKVLAVNNTLKKLCFLFADFTPLGLMFVVRQLIANEGLRVLDLSQGEDTPPDSDVVPMGEHIFEEALRLNNTLQELRLSCCQLASNSLDCIAHGLAQNTGLRVLHLGYNHFGRRSTASHLGTALEVNNTLEELVLTGNRISSMCLSEIASGLENNVGLKVLDLASNSFQGVDGMIALAAALSKNTSLESLDISRNGITSAGVVAFAEGLGANVSLKKLYLESNSWEGEEGVVALNSLAEALIVNTTLQVMSLSQCSLDFNKANPLAKALRRNQILKELHCGGNEIGSVGVMSLVEALRANTGLRTLDLRGSCFDFGCVVAMTEVIKAKTSLVDLQLGGNGVEDRNAMLLIESLKNNRPFERFVLDWGSVGEEVLVAFMDVMSHNTTIKSCGRLPVSRDENVGVDCVAEVARHAGLQSLQRHLPSQLNRGTILENYCSRNIALQFAMRVGRALTRNGTQLGPSTQTLPLALIPVVLRELRKICFWDFQKTSSSMLYLTLRNLSQNSSSWNSVRKYCTSIASIAVAHANTTDAAK